MGQIVKNVGNSDSSSENCELFRTLAYAYQSYAKDAGVDLLTFRNTDLPLFKAKNPDEQKRILQALKVVVKICEDVRIQGHKMSDSPALVWSALREFGLRPPSDLFSYITDENVIEILSLDGVQIFRNFNFYKFCSYSLEEIYCGTWNSLFERDNQIVQQGFVFLSKIWNGEVQNTIPSHIPPHLVREISSELKMAIELNVAWGAPLFEVGTQRVGAAMVVEIAQILDKGTTRDQPARQPLTLLKS